MLIKNEEGMHVKAFFIKLFKALLLLIFLLAAFLIIENISSDYRANRDLKMQVKPYSFQEINGIPVHYKEEGEGPSLVLIHGFMGHLGLFDPIWDTLAQNHRVIALDLPGFGLSGNGTSHKKALADLVAAFLSEKKVKDAILIGHSLGGEIAQHIAIEHPELVKKLVLIDTAGIYQRQQKSLLSLHHVPASKLYIQYVFKTYFFQSLLVHFSSNDYSALKANHLRRTFAINRKISPDILVQFGKVNDEHTVFPDPSRIQVPTLIIWGEEDRVISSSHGSQYQKRIRHSTLVLIPKCGHSPFLEKTEQFLKVLDSFIRETPS